MTLKELQPQIRDSLDRFLQELKQKHEDIHVAHSQVIEDEAHVSRARVDRPYAYTCTQSPRQQYRGKTPYRGPPRQTYQQPPSRPSASSQPHSKECRICKAEKRYYMGHTFGECDYVSKAEKREAIRSCKVLLDEGPLEDISMPCTEIADLNIHESF